MAAVGGRESGGGILQGRWQQVFLVGMKFRTTTPKRRNTFLLFAKALLAVARQLKKIGFFFLCPNPTPPAVCNPNYRGIACNPNYRGGKLKAASWVAAKRTPHPTRLHRGSNPDPPFCSVPPLPLRQHSPRNYCFHKYINPKYLSLTLMVFG